MKKIAILLTILAASSCTVRTTPIQNTNFDDVDFSQIRMFESGKSCKRFILGIIPLPFGQPSLINAVKNGRIRDVKVVDYEYGLTLIPPGTKNCLVAYGLR